MSAADENQIKDAIKIAANKYGRLNIRVNNAAIRDRALLEDTSADLMDRPYQVNQRGPLLCMREVAPIMKAGGRGANDRFLARARPVGSQTP